MGHFGHTYLPMSNVFYTMPITLVRFLLIYLPTPKSDVLYERSLICIFFLFLGGTIIGPTTILTAAHCVDQMVKLTTFVKILIAEHDWTSFNESESL